MPVQPQLFPDPEPLPDPTPKGAREPTPEATSLRGDLEPGRSGTSDGPSENEADDAADNPVHNSVSTAKTAPIWLQRVSLLVLVLFCVYLGILVMVLPWWSRIWDHNEYMQARPALYTFLHNGAVRGLISGLGLLDIWIGVSEAVHYRDYRP